MIRSCTKKGLLNLKAGDILVPKKYPEFRYLVLEDRTPDHFMISVLAIPTGIVTKTNICGLWQQTCQIWKANEE